MLIISLIFVVSIIYEISSSFDPSFLREPILYSSRLPLGLYYLSPDLSSCPPLLRMRAYLAKVFLSPVRKNAMSTSWLCKSGHAAWVRRGQVAKKYSLSFHHKRGARPWPPLVRCVPVVPFCPYIKGMVSTSIIACPPFTSTANTSNQMSRVQVVQCGNVASLNLLQTRPRLPLLPNR